MPWRGPEYPGEFPSLGYEILDWIESNLVIPDGENHGEPLIPTREQAAFTIRLFRIDPKRGRLFYRGGQLTRPKGWGKSPFAGALSWAAAKGPIQFDGWNANGNPVGRPRPTPWVQIAAAAEGQTDNTWTAVLGTAADAPILDSYPDIDIGLTRVFVNGGTGKIEYVTSRAGTREGQRTTFAVLDETHLWFPHNGGTKLARTLRRNLGKMNGLGIETTNMFEPGERSVAEITYDNPTRDFLLDAGPEVPEVPDLSLKRPVRKALKIAYGDSTEFVDLDRILSEVQDPRTPPNEARRFYFNQRVTGADSWLDPAVHWTPNATDFDVEPGEPIGLAFTGARYSDGAALYACHVETGHLFPIRIWLADGEDWELPTDELTDAVEDTFTRYTVGRFYVNTANPAWDSYLDRWIADHGKRTVAAWSTNREAAWAHTLAAFKSAAHAGELSHDGTQITTDHATRARTRPTKRAKDSDGNRMYTIERPHPGRSIVAIQAAVLAFEARGDALASGVTKKKRRTRSRGF